MLNTKQALGHHADSRLCVCVCNTNKELAVASVLEITARYTARGSRTLEHSYILTIARTLGCELEFNGTAKAKIQGRAGYITATAQGNTCGNGSETLFRFKRSTSSSVREPACRCKLQLLCLLLSNRCEALCLPSKIAALSGALQTGPNEAQPQLSRLLSNHSALNRSISPAVPAKEAVPFDFQPTTAPRASKS